MEINYGIKITLNREEKMETKEEIVEGKLFDETMDWFRNLSLSDRINVLIDLGILNDKLIKELAEEEWTKIKDYLEA